jgi:hypothetical protein
MLGDLLRTEWNARGLAAELEPVAVQRLATEEAALPNGDRQFVVLPQTTRSADYSKNRHLLFYAVHNFLAAPLPAGA